MRKSFSIMLCVVAFACAKREAPEDLPCSGCRADGEACTGSFECAFGRICNDPVDELFEASRPTNVCVRVVCQTDRDCGAPKLCTLENLCRPPICEGPADCSAGEACLAGVCGPPPSAALAVRCVVETPDVSLAFGASVALDAVAFDPDGRVIPLAAFEWSSSDPEVASISGSTAIAGERAGLATIRATVRDAPGVGCDGPTLRTFDEVADGSVRVLVVDGKSGAPISDMEVTVFAGAMQSGLTDVNGRFERAVTSTVQSVTVVKDGWRSISVLAPGTNDVFIAASRSNDVTRAGGIRGRVDLSATQPADVPAAVVYSARPLDLFEYRSLPTVDLVQTALDAPELGLDSVGDLPGNLLVGLGDKQFTRDGLRCRDTSPGPDGHLGCFLTRAPEGRTAAWVMGGQIRLSQVTGPANEGFAVEEEDRFTAKDRARLILLLSPITQSMWFGALPHLDIQAHPKVRTSRDSGVDCTDPARAITAACRADFDAYEEVELPLAQPPVLASVLTAPTLPQLPSGDCAGAMVVSSYAVLPGRGLLLVGLATSRDVDENCEVDRVPRPFGELSEPLPSGRIPLRSAPLHSGLEGSQRLLVVAAVDVGEGETRSLDLNLIFEPFDRLGRAHDLSSRRFLPHPEGALERSTATFTVSGPVRESAASGLRVTFESAAGSWIVYAPPSLEVLHLPDVATPRRVMEEAQLGTLQAFEQEGTYAELWSARATRRIDRAIAHLRAIATTQCGPEGPCAF